MANDWIEWKGGNCPVDLESRVDVMTKRGDVLHYERALEWDWQSQAHDNCIAYYRPSRFQPRKFWAIEFIDNSAQSQTYDSREKAILEAKKMLVQIPCLKQARIMKCVAVIDSENLEVHEFEFE